MTTSLDARGCRISGTTIAAILLFPWAIFSAGAQSIGGHDPRAIETRAPAWMQWWSPLAPIADLSRPMPRSAPMPMLLGAPAPRVGLFWTGGNPSALRDETINRYAAVAAQLSNEEGSYHRPLDPGAVDTRQIHGIGWQQIRERGAAIGSILVASEYMQPEGFGDVSTPYRTVPIVTTDTSRPDMRRVRARLEGAVGYQLGGWGLGLGLGIETQDYRTENARFPRTSRSAIPGVMVGVSRSLRGVRLAVHGRWLGGAEAFTLNPIPASGQAHLLFGYAEPDPISVALPTNYFRRIERSGSAIGAAASGELLGATVVVMAEREVFRESQSSQRLSSGETDEWDADGFRVAAALQARPVTGLLITGWLTGRRLEGAATRIGLTGDVFRATENGIRGTLDIRYATRDSLWQFGAVGTAGREYRLREDFVALLFSEVTSWSPGVSLEMARRLDSRTAIAFGTGIRFVAASARLPNPENLGPVYRSLIAPELALDATDSRPTTVSLTAMRQFTDRLSGWARGWSMSYQPLGDVELPLRPSGDRSTWSITIGAELR